MRTPFDSPGAGGRALFVDVYELTMADAYLAAGLAERPAVFELLFRSLPPGWGYLVAAGLDDALETLETLAFAGDELAHLESLGLFSPALLDRLARFRFSGDVRALPEGTPAFPGEPLLQVAGPVLEAQLVETLVLNLVHFASLATAKASRCVTAADGRSLVEFGTRRTHGLEAGVKVARAAYLAGFEATSNVLAGRLLGIPVAGTMAHSFVECFTREEDAFLAFARSYPHPATLLVDTYDTAEGARRAARVARTLRAEGRTIRAVRLDSGDLGALARDVRAILDEAGLPEVEILATGSLDERSLDRLLREGAPIDAFGIGSRLGTSADAPYLDMAYKLVELDGRPVLKLSPGKATLPGAKQVWRVHEGGRPVEDVVALPSEPAPSATATPLLAEVMRDGRRTHRERLDDARARLARLRAELPEALRAVDAGPAYPVRASDALRALRDRAERAVHDADRQDDDRKEELR